MYITFGWGGCGNLVKNCLTSNSNYEQVCNYYQHMNPGSTWTDQEWNIRNDRHYELKHDYTEGGIKLVWSNPIDTSFHYILKNINLNHLTGEMSVRVKSVINFNVTLERILKRHEHALVEEIIATPTALYRYCSAVDPTIQLDRVTQIHQLWCIKTREYSEQHSKTVLGYFDKLGIDSPFW